MSKHTHSVFPIPTFQALLTAPLVILKEKVVPFQSSTSTSPFGVLSRALAGSPNRWAPSWKAGHALWTPTVVVLGEHLESQRAFTSRSPVGWSEKWTNQGAWSADHSHWTVTEATTNGLLRPGGPQTWGWYTGCQTIENLRTMWRQIAASSEHFQDAASKLPLLGASRKWVWNWSLGYYYLFS